MTTATVAGIDVRPLTGCIGAEVLGVDLAHLDDATWDAIHSAWLEHLVLFFPEQGLTPDNHVAVGRRLGEVEIHPFLTKLDDAHPEIVVFDSERGGTADIWHTDVTFSATPPIASILQMMQGPSRGGDTLWSNQYRAYETLSEPIRDLLDGLSAVHTATSFGHAEITATHPVVPVHPETRRPSLFVNRSFTSHIVELRRAESDALLEYLYRWAEQPEFQCRYRWHRGTVAIWDNRCTQHYAVNDYDARRVVQRVTVLGDRPAGGPLKWPTLSDSRTSPQSAPNADPHANSVPVQPR